MSCWEDLVLVKDGPVARIRLARPERLNAFRNQTADELREALVQADSDSEVRCVVLTGEGRAFGAGYDLSSIDPDTTLALDTVLDAHFNPLIRQIRCMRVPVVAAVNGPCAGSAVGIALAADIVIAARSAYFYQPFASLSLAPDAGNSAFLTQFAGRIRAAGMMLLGDRISAEQALQFGLIWRVFDDADLPSETQAIADLIVTLDPKAVAATKRLIRHASDGILDAQLDLERDLQGDLGRAPQLKAAVAGFLSARGGARHVPKAQPGDRADSVKPSRRINREGESTT